MRLDDIRAHQHDKEQRWYDIPRLISEPSDKRNVRDKALMTRLIHRLAKEHNQSRHQQEYGKQTQHNRPDETKRHIASDAKLHEHHRNQTAYRRERA